MPTSRAAALPLFQVKLRPNAIACFGIQVKVFPALHGLFMPKNPLGSFFGVLGG
jgi:hypothetical protein